MTELVGRIDELLAERRPDRYETVSGDEWLDQIAAEVAGLVPAAQAQYRSARMVVGQREGNKTRRTNKLLREIYRSGQLPLDWLQTLNLPLAVGKERVAIRACIAKDFENFAIEERRAAARDFSTRHETCEAAEWIAKEMVAAGISYGRDLDYVLEVATEGSGNVDDLSLESGGAA